MNNLRSCIKRLLLTTGLAVAVVGAVLVTVLPAGADPQNPGAGPLTLPAPSMPVGPAPAPLTLDRFAIIEVGGTAATLDVAASAPSIFSYTIRRVDGRVHDDRSGTAGLPTSGYQGEYRVRLLSLQSNTTYEVAVYATNGDGQTSATTRFTTPKQRVRVTLREINITEDGDSFWMNGEPSWQAGLEWAGGTAGGCYPNNGNICETGSHSEGRIFPKNYLGQPLMWLFAEENFDRMPDAFTLTVEGNEYDLVPLGPLVDIIEHGPRFGSPSAPFEWQVPARQEWASTPAFLTASKVSQGFQSTMAFTFELFYDNLSYTSARNMPQSTWGR